MITNNVILFAITMYSFVIIMSNAITYQRNRYDINHDGEVNIVDLSVLAVKINERQ